MSFRVSWFSFHNSLWLCFSYLNFPVALELPPTHTHTSSLKSLPRFNNKKFEISFSGHIFEFLLFTSFCSLIFQDGIDGIPVCQGDMDNTCHFHKGPLQTGQFGCRVDPAAKHLLRWEGRSNVLFGALFLSHNKWPLVVWSDDSPLIVYGKSGKEKVLFMPLLPPSLPAHPHSLLPFSSSPFTHSCSESAATIQRLLEGAFSWLNRCAKNMHALLLGQRGAQQLLKGKDDLI